MKQYLRSLSGGKGTSSATATFADQGDRSSGIMKFPDISPSFCGITHVMHNPRNA